jgi:hypothetical protein
MNAALPPDICAFGDLIAIVFGEADPPLGCVGRKSGAFFARLTPLLSIKTQFP